MFCPMCGGGNVAGAEYCAACGARLRSAGPRMTVPVKPLTSGLATASLVLGIVSFLCGLLAAVPGLVIGIIALLRIRDSKGQLGGKGLAIAGVALSGAGLLLAVVGVVVQLVIFGMLARGGGFWGPTVPAPSCQSNVKQVVLACQLYAHDNGEDFPDSLGRLFPDYVNDGGVLVCPDAFAADAITRDDLPQGAKDASKVLDEDYTDYVYVKGLNPTSPSDAVLVYDGKDNHDGEGRNVGLVGGNVQWMSESALEAALKKTQKVLKAGGPGER